jgi:hypothetical protein
MDSIVQGADPKNKNAVEKVLELCERLSSKNLKDSKLLARLE